MNHRLLDSGCQNAGRWEETAWHYDDATSAMVKRLSWSVNVRTRPDGIVLPLCYVAEARVDPKHMDDLEHLSEQEQSARSDLEARIFHATLGRAYVAKPNPVPAIQRATIAVVTNWMQSTGYPDDWEEQLRRTIARAAEPAKLRLVELERLNAVEDPKHPAWGLVVAIDPVTAPFGSPEP